ncbi:hypothetical protein LEMA_P104260.1 [Plenodomus lingam JN3]|uniref:Heterokaryon incompatibility domain-containing protein n=1 Tax=Leptosphaeria maculans (strain JN3 / isolate v23.1.3 / race Av1-4-5-6-7-8) TaxID=985895 RepID=E5A0Z9_LEPMJ|nr:hypothetical protein LEMA_P104260.1 [Plenodomus lingam JN3]CBX97295.1 hypothetical protein LEMA_P104260.1 [Plenodomus lingam JN3]
MSSSTPCGPSYRYEPLDASVGSIRLLTILPHLSGTGLIQCKIWHDTVDATYTCLSYAWGSEDGEQLILLNGNEFRVRKNLWDFMKTAKQKYADQPRSFWIDALSIDQESRTERNHQVAQMGLVYSNGVEVISWLGLDQRICRAIKMILPPSPYYTAFCKGEGFKIWDQLNPQLPGQLKRDWLAVTRADYWMRAWITQEIYLARKVILLVDNVEIEATYMSRMAPFLGHINELEGDKWLKPEYWDTDTRVFFTYLYAFANKAPTKLRLIDFFNLLPGRVCEHPRDRVYSLLALASDTNGITVDYNGPISDVVLQLLRTYRTTMFRHGT